MGYVVVKQTKTDLIFVTDEGEEFPLEEGKYSVWSTFVDDFVLANATKEEVVEFYVEEAVKRTRDETTHRLELMEKGRRFSNKTFEDCLRIAQRNQDGSIRQPKKE